MEIKRLLTNLCSTDLVRSKEFYTSLFDLSVDFDSDWFVHLISVGSAIEIGIILEDHEIVPEPARGRIKGGYLTFVVEDVDALHLKAKDLRCKIIQSPELTPYGQKRMLIEAPEGTVCDVSSPT